MDNRIFLNEVEVMCYRVEKYEFMTTNQNKMKPCFVAPPPWLPNLSGCLVYGMFSFYLFSSKTYSLNVFSQFTQSVTK